MSWEKLPLEAVADFCLGKMLDQKKNRGDLLPYLANVNVRWGHFELGDLRKMRFEHHELDRFGLRQGDIVMCEGGEPGRCAIWKEQMPSMMFQKALHRIRPRECLNNKFLYYFLLHKGWTGHLAHLFTGATIKHLPREKLARVEIEVPPLPIQDRIASALSSYDDMIENNRRRIRLLEQAAQLLYREWFVHLRFPGHEHTTITDGIPEGWERRTAFEAMEVLSGGTPKTKMPGYWNGRIPFFTPKDATDSVYALDTEKTLTEDGLRNCNSSLYPKDTAFITARGTVGKINLAHTDMAMNQSCYALVARPPLNQHFLYFALVESVEHFRGRAVGAVFDTITRDTFKLIPFSIPNHAQLQMFSEKVAPILRQSYVLLQNVRCLVRARDLLLPRLMNGEVTL